MRYKAFSSALSICILLIATPVFSQESSPIIVETPRTAKPTTVITGQPFVQIYVVRYIDMSEMGGQVVVSEKDLRFKYLDDFEVVDFSIDKQVKNADFTEHWWYLRYTLRIVNPKKGPVIIKPIVIPWKYKKSGQEENDPSIQVNYNLKTEEVHLNYASTIPAKDPYLSVRDDIDFGSYERSALVLFYFSWFLAVFPVSILLLFFAFRLRSGEAVREESADRAKDDYYPVAAGKISSWRIRKNLRASIANLRSLGSRKPVPYTYREAMSGLLRSLMDYLRYNTPKSRRGMTPSDLRDVISKISDGPGKDILHELALRAISYQQSVECGTEIENPSGEARELARLVRRFRLYRRAFAYITYYVSRILHRRK